MHSHTTNRLATPLLIFLLLASLTFILLHVLKQIDLVADPLFNLGRERGYSALFLFGLEFCLLLLMASMALRQRQPVYFHWTTLFAYFFFDDVLEIHETVGDALAAIWSFPVLFDLRPQDWGEMIVYAATGLYFLLTLILTYPRSDAPARQFSRHLLLLVLVLVGVGIGVDMAYYMVESELLREAFVILEDGGEIVVISVILWAVFGRVAQMRSSEPHQIQMSSRPTPPIT